MDRLVYVAMGSAGQDRLMETTLANNLANANTIGYKADQVSFKSLYLNGTAHPTRIYSRLNGTGVDLKQGPLRTTGRQLDIAMRGNAWLSVTAPDGKKGYVHTASIQVNGNGVLVTQNGCVVNSQNGFSITVPRGDPVSIDKHGGVSVTRNGQPQIIDQLKIQELPKKFVYKTPDGLIQVEKNAEGGIREATGNIVRSGVLEQSNVSEISTLVRMMQLSQQYEADISQISEARKIDTSANELLNVR